MDDQALRLAAFVVQALELEEDPRDLAPEIVALKRDRNAGISSIELDSSVGPAAFLIYHYALKRKNDEGKTGRQLFAADLRTLETAAARETPGPRIAAHATTDDEAYILATTPATYRALTGAETAPAEPPHGDLTEVRREAAIELLGTLRAADHHAQMWFAAIQAEGPQSTSSGGALTLDTFLEEETALALFLLDDRSIQNLLHVLNHLISAAREQAEGAFESGRNQE
ncbi:MAG: hypothetical protein ACJ789_03990 [Thermomicrobiales bacterium]